MKVLVTGAAGFIASHIVDGLVSDGHEVAVVDNLSRGVVGNVNPDARLYRCDITDAEALAKVFDTERPEIVDHHAAQTDVRRSMADPASDARANVIGSINVLQQCVKYDVRRVIFASTCAVYSEPQYIPMDELHPLGPQSGYGLSKLTVENYLRLFAETYGVRYKVLRYGNVYGPRQDPAGEAGVVAIFADQLRGKVQPTIYGDGSKTRDYVYVSDVVDANILCMGDVGDNEVFNIARGVEVSDQEIFDSVRTAVGGDMEPRYAQKRPGESDRVCLDCSKATAVLGWSPRVSLEAGVQAAVAYHGAVGERTASGL